MRSILHPHILFVIGIVLFAHAGSFFYFSYSAARNIDAAPYPLVRGDSENYAAIADTMLAHGVYGRAQSGGAVELERHWPPGYSFILAATKALSGGWLFAIMIQIALALGAVLLVYKMAQRLVPTAWAAGVALIFGVQPMYVFSNTSIISDGFFASMLVGTVYLALFYTGATMREPVRWVLVGLLVGALTLIRPIAQFLILAIPLFLSLRWALERHSWRAYVLAAVPFSLAALLVVAPWVWWTHEKFDVYEVSHVGASNLLWYNAQDFLAWKEMNRERHVPAILASRYRNDPAYAVVHAEIRRALDEATPSGGTVANYEGAVAARIILQDPWRYAYFHFINTAPLFLGSSIAAYNQVAAQVRESDAFYAPTALAILDAVRAARDGSWGSFTQVLPIVFEMLVWALAFILAAFATWKRRGDTIVLAFVAIITYFALLTGPVAIARYRIPIEPFVLILATTGLHAIVRSIQRHVPRS